MLSITFNKMTIIEVLAFWAFEYSDDIGEPIWGETGTKDYYSVTDTLEAYLGENVLISTNPTNSTFIIDTNDEDDEGCDSSYDYIEIVDSIYDGAYSYDHRITLWFEILNVT